MSLIKMKAFEWIVDDISIIKIESINSYLNEAIEYKNIALEIGTLRIIETAESDMIFAEDDMEMQLNDNTDYWVSLNERINLFDIESLQEMLKNTIEVKGIVNSKN